MKHNKKMFIAVEAVLAVLVIVLLVSMIQARNKKNLDRIAVVVQNSNNSQWAGFKYGLKMAAQDLGVEMIFVSTEGVLTVEEEKDLIESELDNGADAIIVQPIVDDGVDAMLKEIQKKVPVMLVGYTDVEDSKFPITQPDQYAMGKALAEEFLKDNNHNVDGKTIGIVSENEQSKATAYRTQGFRDALKDTGVKISWTTSVSEVENVDIELGSKNEVDFVIALDTYSLTETGKCSASQNLHGALVYGIGNSTESVYYLDTGHVQCLVVPDEYNVGYQSLKETADCIGQLFQKMDSQTVSYAVLRRDQLFDKKNQEIIYTMSQ